METTPRSEPHGRPLKAQLATARMLLAQYAAQIDEYDAMNREQRRTPHGKDLSSRIAGLRSGVRKWMTRAAELEAQIEAEKAGRRIMTDLKMWEIEDSGPLVRIDKHKLPDLDDLMLDVLTTPGIVDRNREIWEDAADDGEDRPTTIPDTDSWYLGEALVGFYRTNPCTCGEEHQFDMAEVPMDDDGQPLGAASRGAFLGVFFR